MKKFDLVFWLLNDYILGSKESIIGWILKIYCERALGSELFKEISWFFYSKELS